VFYLPKIALEILILANLFKLLSDPQTGLG
jgi:hypothetical protein